MSDGKSGIRKEKDNECSFILKNLNSCGPDRLCMLSKIKEYEFCCRFKDYYFKHMKYNPANKKQNEDIIDTYFYS